MSRLRVTGDADATPESAVRTYPEGGRFNGVIGSTIATSIPAWPLPPMPPRGAPNIVIVLLDDVGFAQLGCFGSTIRTPNLDRLAASGLIYRNFHTTSLCSPSRACLLTGRNAHANGSAYLPYRRGFPGSSWMIPKNNGFLSEILGQTGYATFAIGKWHLSPQEESSAGSRRNQWPLSRGFDRFYGYLDGATDQWIPDLVYDNHTVAPPARPEHGYHLNSDMADRAIEFISDLRVVDPDKPFFLYYCPTAGHMPHHVPRNWADRYRGLFDQGWDSWRDRVFERQLEMGVIPPGTRLSGRPSDVPGWASLSVEEQRLCARQMEVFAGFLEHTDHHVGRLVAYLERIGEIDQTLFIVTSDNGACGVGGRLGRNGYRDVTADMLSEASTLIDDWGSAKTYPDYALGWAWAGNTPLRKWKRFVHEGGVTVPFIIHWPRGIESRNEIRGQYIHIIDVLPTVLDVIGIPEPSEIGGIKQSPIHGLSFAHTFNDGSAPTRKTTQYYEMLGSRAIWSNDWKAVTEQKPDVLITDEILDRQNWELFHLETDPSEVNNLVDQYPERLRSLIAQWWVEAGKYGVLPLTAYRAGSLSPLGTAIRRQFVYYPQARPVHWLVAAKPVNRSHRITAQLEIPETGAEGIIVAHGGGMHGGYALLVRNNRLQYIHSYYGDETYRVTADGPLPQGRIDVQYEFMKRGAGIGTGMLCVNGHEVGRNEDMRNMLALPVGKLCCGYDSGWPVDDYETPFRFTGTITKVVIDLLPDRAEPRG